MDINDIKDLLFKICENKDVYNDNIDLIENNILDSLAILQLFTYFEDNNYDIQITQIDRNKLRTAKGIEELISEYKQH